jgi:hypothetical protein
MRDKHLFRAYGGGIKHTCKLVQFSIVTIKRTTKLGCTQILKKTDNAQIHYTL